MKIKVKVTDEHIKHAVRKDSHRCMIADAIHAANPDCKYVLVDLQSIRWSNIAKGERYIAMTPPIAQAKLLSFDQGKSVDPFMFTVHSIKTKKVGWQANHPNTSRKGKRFRKTGLKKYRPRKDREFGLRMLFDNA